MTRLNCEYVRDVYPDVLAGRADHAVTEAVRAHLATCDECRSEAALIDALYARPASVPQALHDRVTTAVAQHRVRRRFSRSDMAMVATLAAALIGGSVIVQTHRNEPRQSPVTAESKAAPAGVGFVGVEDAMLSGESSLDNLSVEQLEKLLGEIES